MDRVYATEMMVLGLISNLVKSETKKVGVNSSSAEGSATKNV